MELKKWIRYKIETFQRQITNDVFERVRYPYIFVHFCEFNEK